MILSVSRRTDIPNYYSDWFFHRIKESFVYVSLYGKHQDTETRSVTNNVTVGAIRVVDYLSL